MTLCQEFIFDGKSHYIYYCINNDIVRLGTQNGILKLISSKKSKEKEIKKFIKFENTWDISCIIFLFGEIIVTLKCSSAVGKERTKFKCVYFVRTK